MIPDRPESPPTGGLLPRLGRVALVVALLAATAGLARIAFEREAGRADRVVEAPSSADPAALRPDPAASGVRRRARLPEDPLLARQATEQWTEHLEEEETHRRLCYDRDRLAEHRSLVESTSGVQALYDGATSKAELARLRPRAAERVASARERLRALDPWDNSSGVAREHAALLDLLEEKYPEAALAALAGDSGRLEELRAELARRAAIIQAWLGRAAACRDE